MNKTDYVVFFIGNILLLFSFVIAFKDEDIAGYMYLTGNIGIVYFVVRGGYKLYKKRFSKSEKID